ncbi:ATP-binding cassette domain-containing protein [Buttiauxella sp. B2]|uniref:energy-coupling factor ABC transporter ATP-binding protein n=1 Tax=Buttiauxella sp. B2 TaxID=2587812 RepID=UPI001120D3BD|nr:ATP-binding cassette domain-containing protein [Buttiauxella sp. B2]TNV20933.1 ATP-binding cassette domain-containing protein [Buttiauxella sp. B2]
MLNLENVDFRWPHATQLCLKGLSLNIQPQEWVALSGDNGAGKSTLLRLMAGLLSPCAGIIKVQGHTLAQLKAKQRAAIIGVLFQEAENQVLHSKVIDEVAFGLRLQKLPLDEIERRTTAALTLCGLLDEALAHPLDLHVAQRRMVAVASLEVMAPPLLLLDEPSRDFDEHWLGLFESWLAVCQRRGTTILAISHDQDFTHRHFPRVIRLAEGSITSDGSPA